MPFIKINFIQFICKEKSGAIPKLKLVQKKRNQKFKKLNQLYFGTLVLACTVFVAITRDFLTDFLQTVASKVATTWRLKQSQSNDKLS